jgi:hypothetical protein
MFKKHLSFRDLNIFFFLPFKKRCVVINVIELQVTKF